MQFQRLVYIVLLLLKNCVIFVCNTMGNYMVSSDNNMDKYNSKLSIVIKSHFIATLVPDIPIKGQHKFSY